MWSSDLVFINHVMGKLISFYYFQVLREYNHVNPQDDDEGKIFLNSRVRQFCTLVRQYLSAKCYCLGNLWYNFIVLPLMMLSVFIAFECCSLLPENG